MDGHHPVLFTAAFISVKCSIIWTFFLFKNYNDGMRG